jgi:hypothetical protein
MYLKDNISVIDCVLVFRVYAHPRVIKWLDGLEQPRDEIEKLLDFWHELRQ